MSDGVSPKAASCAGRPGAAARTVALAVDSPTRAAACSASAVPNRRASRSSCSVVPCPSWLIRTAIVRAAARKCAVCCESNGVWVVAHRYPRCGPSCWTRQAIRGLARSEAGSRKTGSGEAIRRAMSPRERSTSTSQGWACRSRIPETLSSSALCCPFDQASTRNSVSSRTIGTLRSSPAASMTENRSSRRPAALSGPSWDISPTSAGPAVMLDVFCAGSGAAPGTASQPASPRKRSALPRRIDAFSSAERKSLSRTTRPAGRSPSGYG